MKYRLVVVIIMTFLYSTTAKADYNLEEKAENLVSQYLVALIQGDTELLLGSIGGDFLESRRILLQNPDYPTYLTEVYTGASASVTGSRQLSANSVEVDAVIEKTADEKIDLIFLVEVVKEKEKKLLIVAEQGAEKQ